MNAQDQTSQVKKQLITEVKYLMVRNKIKPFPGVEQLSEETLKEIIQEYNNSKLSGINKTILTGLVNIAGIMAKHSGTLEEETVDTLTEEFLSSEDVVGCSSSVISYITPNIPMVGIITGSIIAGKFLFDGLMKAREKTAPENPEEQEFHDTSET